MIIGVPRERKTLEQRVALTPDGASELNSRGHKVLVETEAGHGSLFSDKDYTDAGCEVVKTLGEVWTRAEMVVKVKEPHEDEFQYFRPGLVLFDYLHLAGLPQVASKLLEQKVTGIAYELVQLADNRLPLLEPMSEVAGKLSIIVGSHYLLSQNGGRGVLAGRMAGVFPRKVVVIGGGIAGRAAASLAVGMGDLVSILDISTDRLKELEARFGKQVKLIHSTHASLLREVETADLLVGAVLVPGASAPKVITREMIKNMPPRSVFVDISVDQGGCAETTRTTSLSEPIYVEEEVIHYAVPNMPAQCPLTSTMALTAATLPYILQLADHGIEKLISSKPEIKKAVNTYKGHMTNQACARSLGLEYVAVDSL